MNELSLNNVNELLLVLMPISAGILAFMLPFAYGFMKNLDGEMYKEIYGLGKLLKGIQGGQEEDPPNQVGQLKEEIKCARKIIGDC